MGYKSIKIENFRGIKSLEISDLKQINLLVGRNSCGKTSILEAFFLISGLSNPILPIIIHKLRNLLLANDEDFSFMFSNFEFTSQIHINASIDNQKRDLTITPNYSDLIQKQIKGHEKEEIIKLLNGTSASTSTAHTVNGLNFNFSLHKDHIYHSKISLNEGKSSIDNNYKENLICHYLSPGTDMADFYNQIDNLLINKKMGPIISVLKSIEPRISDISTGARGMIYVDIGIDKLMPVNVVGDGIKHLLSKLAAITNAKNGVVLIDEIENGFHHTSLSVAWKAIIAACKELDVQLIAATHSYECVEAFIKTYRSMEPEGDDIRLFRIDREENKHKSYKYTSHILEAGIEKGFEVR